MDIVTNIFEKEHLLFSKSETVKLIADKAIKYKKVQ